MKGCSLRYGSHCLGPEKRLQYGRVSAIKKALETARLPDNVHNICGSFLEERVVCVGKTTKGVTRGGPQGSSLGPSLWLIVMEGWFERMRKAKDGNEDRVDGGKIGNGRVKTWRYQAYEDDQVICIGGPSAKRIEKELENAWRVCENWANENKLTYNKNKTTGMFCETQGQIRWPSVKMGNTRIKLERTVKYLGIKIDNKLNFIEHMRYTKATLGRVAAKLHGSLQRRAGYTRTIAKIIFERVIKPAVLYGSEVWCQRWEDSRTKKSIDSGQRILLRYITPAFRTTSTEALRVIGGVNPGTSCPNPAGKGD